MPYLSASAVVIHYEEALYQVYAPFTFTFKKCRDLENWVRGLSRSLKMSLFDKAHDFLLTFYSNYMALSRVVSEIFNVKQ